MNGRTMISTGQQQYETPIGTKITIGFLRALGRLPFSLRSKCGYYLGCAVGLFPSREQRIARAQLRAFLGGDTRAMTRRAFGSAGSYLLEVLSLQPMLSASYPKITCTNWERITHLLNSDRPVVAFTAHTGNWDLLAAYCIARGAKVSTIGREARHPIVQGVLTWMREQYGIETIWRSDRSGLKRLISCFREKRVIAALIDQDTRVESIFVPFFGRPARTPSSLAALGKKFDAYFVTAFIVRTADDRFEITIEELPQDIPDEEMLTLYNSRLEAIIRKYPEQWVWFHKRWRSMPDGHTLSSSEYLKWLDTLAVRDS